MKGILLAGGSGSRLGPLTTAFCKHLLPVYNKPMIFYPLSVLMLAGIREILLISRKEDQDLFKKLLGNGAQWGIKIDYAVQSHPAGIADGLIVGESFLAGDSCAFALGDNLLYRDGIQSMLASARNEVEANGGAKVFASHVSDAREYGVIEIDNVGRIVSIEEKPKCPRSQFAVVGLYFYDGSASAKARALQPSARGELEITDLNLSYLSEGSLRVQKLGRGTIWMDMGTPDYLLEASQLIQALEQRQGLKIADPFEVAALMRANSLVEVEHSLGHGI